MKGISFASVVGIAAIVTAVGIVIFPLFASAREFSGTTCTSALKSLVKGYGFYAADYDGNFTFDYGWAGRMSPYMIGCQCPKDRTPFDSQTWFPDASVVSYAMNDNLHGKSASQIHNPNKTVFYFEVEKSSEDLYSHWLPVPPSGPFRKRSAVGIGVYRDLIEGPLSAPRGSEARYAGRPFDNSNAPRPILGFFGPKPRHEEGQGIGFADGHAQWFAPRQVSAGVDARSPDSYQLGPECGGALRGRTGLPCAEGSEAGSHSATFSTR